MFHTRDSTQLPAFSVGPTTTGDRFWPLVEIAFRHNWFVASFTGRAQTSAPRTVIVSELSTITRLLADYGVVLHQLVLATPPNINGTERWLFEDLVEAWECHSSHTSGFSVLLYEVASGTKYLDRVVPQLPDEHLTKVRKVFPVGAA